MFFSEDADILTEALPGDQYVAIDGKKTYFDIGPGSGGKTYLRIDQIWSVFAR